MKSIWGVASLPSRSTLNLCYLLRPVWVLPMGAPWLGRESRRRGERGTGAPLPCSLLARSGPAHSPLSFLSLCVGHFVVIQSLSRVRLFVTPWTAARQASLSITNSWSLLKLMSIESVMPSSHLILCCPLLLPPSIFPSIMVFSNESFLCIRWPKYWSFSFSISPSNEYSGLISFRTDWLGLLAVQGTLKSLFQHHNLKASILPHSAFFIIQLLYMTTGKTIALTRWTFIGKLNSPSQASAICEL